MSYIINYAKNQFDNISQIYACSHQEHQYIGIIIYADNKLSRLAIKKSHVLNKNKTYKPDIKYYNLPTNHPRNLKQLLYFGKGYFIAKDTQKKPLYFSLNMNLASEHIQWSTEELSNTTDIIQCGKIKFFVQQAKNKSWYIYYTHLNTPLHTPINFIFSSQPHIERYIHQGQETNIFTAYTNEQVISFSFDIDTGMVRIFYNSLSNKQLNHSSLNKLFKLNTPIIKAKIVSQHKVLIIKKQGLYIWHKKQKKITYIKLNNMDHTVTFGQYTIILRKQGTIFFTTYENDTFDIKHINDILQYKTIKHLILSNDEQYIVAEHRTEKLGDKHIEIFSTQEIINKAKAVKPFYPNSKSYSLLTTFNCLPQINI